jgi:hypothetical protein
VGGDEPETLVEAVSVRAALVGGQLDKLAAASASLVDGPGQHRLSEPHASARAVDSDAFDLRPPHPETGQPGDERQLECPDDGALDLGHDLKLVRVGVDRGEGVPVRGGQRIGVLLAGRPKRVVGQHPDNGRDILAGSLADAH